MLSSCASFLTFQIGCGGVALKTSQLYCGAYTDDLRMAVDHIRKVVDEKLLLIGCVKKYSII